MKATPPKYSPLALGLQLVEDTREKLMSTATSENEMKHKRGCLFYLKRGLLFFIILLVGLPLLGFTYETIMAAGDAERYPPPGQLVTVDGYTMHIRCIGEGEPTIIMESGAGGFSLMWSASLVAELSQTTRVCVYDRAGYGWSEPRPETRTAWEIAHELHALLENAQIAPPYVMVGASNGGLYIRSYAAEYPDEVTGLVLVDGTYEAELDQIRIAPSGFFVVMGRLGIFRLLPEMICPGTACNAEAKPMIAALGAGQPCTRRWTVSGQRFKRRMNWGYCGSAYRLRALWAIPHW